MVLKKTKKNKNHFSTWKFILPLTLTSKDIPSMSFKVVHRYTLLFKPTVPHYFNSFCKLTQRFMFNSGIFLGKRNPANKSPINRVPQ